MARGTDPAALIIAGGVALAGWLVLARTQAPPPEPAAGVMAGGESSPIRTIVATAQATLAQTTGGASLAGKPYMTPDTLLATREERTANAAKQAAPNEYPRPLTQGNNATSGVTKPFDITDTVGQGAVFLRTASVEAFTEAGGAKPAAEWLHGQAKRGIGWLREHW